MKSLQVKIYNMLYEIEAFNTKIISTSKLQVSKKHSIFLNKLTAIIVGAKQYHYLYPNMQFEKNKLESEHARQKAECKNVQH